MRRADRLFHIIQLIRGRRLTTAAFLAQRLEVSERTVYRDVADLRHQGVPIEGEAGVGYRLGAGFDLPPLMFTEDEAKALVAAARLAQAWLDPVLACQRLSIRYRDVADQSSQRGIRPLGCFFWGKVWTLAAWCETRQAFRSFRVDRIDEVQRLDDVFRDEAGKTLADFLRQAGASGSAPGGRMTDAIK